MKHRISSEFNEVSSRYVELDSAEFYRPEKFREQSRSDKQGSTEEAVSDVAQAYEHYDNAISQAQRSYNELRNLGVCKEQARCVMPVSQYSEVYWTASLQAVLHFLSLRLDSHAQWEIREFAKAVRQLILTIFPVVVSEYEAIRERSEADAKLAMCAVRLAIADVTFEGKPSKENISTLNSLRGELRSVFADYAQCYTDEL
jgi:thymidylate synthase (FAD)